MTSAESKEQDDDDGYPFSVVLGSTALEKLCISIITANPERDRNRARKPEDRLRAAVNALGGFVARGENEKDDRRLLYRMSNLLGQEVYQEVARLEGLSLGDQLKERSLLMEKRAADEISCRVLAITAANSAGIPVTEALKKRLARKFSERWRALREEAGIAMPPPRSEDELMTEIVPLLNRMGIQATMSEEPEIHWKLSTAK